MRVEDSRRRTDAYDVEIQKKFALSAACIVFVLLGAPVALRFPRGGVGLTIGVSLGVATMTSFFEVLTTMTSGVLLAALLFGLLSPNTADYLNWQLVGELLRLETPTSPMLDRNSLVILSLGTRHSEELSE